MTEYKKQKQKLLKEKEEILELYNKLLLNNMEFNLKIDSEKQKTIKKIYE